MTVYVALLRGINVGGKAKLPMADLRRIAETIGLTDVQTYIQSGNLVFRTARRGGPAIAEELRSAIRADVGVDPAIILRTLAELRDAVAANPFAARGEDVAHLHAIFLDSPASSAALQALDPAHYAPEEFAANGRELYLFLPNGMGRSVLAADLSRRKPTTTGTARNWRTVTTVLAMAEKFA